MPRSTRSIAIRLWTVSGDDGRARASRRAACSDTLELLLPAGRHRGAGLAPSHPSQQHRRHQEPDDGPQAQPPEGLQRPPALADLDGDGGVGQHRATQAQPQPVQRSDLTDDLHPPGSRLRGRDTPETEASPAITGNPQPPTLRGLLNSEPKTEAAGP